MIQAATKYGNVRVQSRAVRPSGRGASLTARRSPALFLPTLTGSTQRLKDWYWRELKEGGWLFNYLNREKARTPKAVRQVARLMHGFKQNPRSDFRRLAAIPAKLYHRWKETDEHFWDDDNNLRSLKRDNPDLAVYVPPRQMPTSRFHKVYAPSPAQAN